MGYGIEGSESYSYMSGASARDLSAAGCPGNLLRKRERRQLLRERPERPQGGNGNGNPGANGKPYQRPDRLHRHRHTGNDLHFARERRHIHVDKQQSCDRPGGKRGGPTSLPSKPCRPAAQRSPSRHIPTVATRRRAPIPSGSPPARCPSIRTL